jgi:ribonuclease-3
VYSDYATFFIVSTLISLYIVLFSRLIDYLYFLACPDKDFARRLRRIMGFYPRKVDVYREALMHRSLNHYRPHEKKKDNERLEYLGDAVIETVVSDILYHHFPKKKEGFLTSTRS